MIRLAFNMTSWRWHGHLLLALCVVPMLGCANLRLPAIDPTGRRIFLPAPNYTTLNGVRDTTGASSSAIPLFDRLRGSRNSAFPSPDPVPACQTPPLLPNGQVAPQVGSIPADPVAPRVLVPGACQDPATAAANANTGFLGRSRTPSHPHAVVALAPRQQVATVGSEVVLIGGVCGGKGYYRVREPVEWTLAQGSVGHFVEPGQPFVGRWGLRGMFARWIAEPLPQLLSNNYAFGCTSCRTQVLTRGTVPINDDLIVESGQAWIGVTSPVEGTSYVNLTAPDLDGWNQRVQTAVIHWVDGNWVLPPSTVIQGTQPHTLTTSVTRRLTGAPLAGWVVRYEILDATATFADGQMVAEILTDAAGQASVQIVPATPDGGTARVHVQVIRPARGAEPDRLIVGEGTTNVTWTTSQLAVRIDGPQSAEYDTSVTYLIEVTNPGAMASQGVTVQSMIPTGMDYVSSTPPARLFGSRLDWAVGDLGPGQRQTFEVTYRAAQSGTVQHCVTASSASGAAVEDCLTTNVTVDALFIDMVGPDETAAPVAVGEEIEYDIAIVNRGDRPLTNVVLIDRFDPGLEHSQGLSPVEWPLGNLDPGERREVGLRFRVVEPGRLCHVLEASADGVRSAQAGACVRAEESLRAEFRVSKTGPSELVVGSEGDFFIIVENTGSQPLDNLQVLDVYDPELRPVAADPTDNRYDRDRVEWIIGRLEPGEKRTFQVTCEAVLDVEEACARAIVTATDGTQLSDDSCLVILPSPANPRDPSPDRPGNNDPPPRLPFGNSDPGFPAAPGRDDVPRSAPPQIEEDIGADANGNFAPEGNDLVLSITAFGERWDVGDTIEYLVMIRNAGRDIERDVQLTVELPPELELVNYGPIRASNPQRDNWRLLRMTPIRALRVDETLEQRIVARVIRAGQFVTRAQLQSARDRTGVMREVVGVAGN